MTTSDVDFSSRWMMSDKGEDMPIRVLYVDDAPVFLKSASEMLEMQGKFEVETATSVREAFEKLEQESFDAVVSDYLMPDLDGLEFLEELRDRGDLIPFVMFTGKSREGVVMEALNLGADSYLHKYGEPETVYGELADSIRKAVEKSLVKKEQELRREQMILEKVTQNVGIGLGINSREYRVLWVNQYIKNFVGDVEGETCYQVFSHRGSVCPGCGVKEIFETGEERVVHEQVVPGYDGEEIWLELTATPLRDQEGNIIAALEAIIDITERKRMEEKLWKSERRLKIFLDSSADMAFLKDEEFRHLLVNDAYLDFLDMDRGEVLGKEDFDLLSYKLAEQCRKSDREALRKGEPLIVVEEYGDRIFETRKFPVALGDGSTGIGGMIRDITERKNKEREIQEKNKELQRMNEKMEVVGKLVRHDVRNKLSTVSNNLYLTRNLLGDYPEVRGYLEDVKSAIGQIKKIFDFAKMYEQLGTQELEPMDVGEAVEDAVKRYPNLQVNIKNECDGLVVQADQMLPHLIYNLIQNSLEHGGEKMGQIRVYPREIEDQVELVYEDNGVGIPEEEEEKIFQEGYGAGTGYGLYLIRKMCEVYGWTIRETGKQGLGAQFTITIPHSD